MTNEVPPPHVRRKRYVGTHPKKFAEKYKELNSEDFAEDIEKVIARGQTPASTHRPICVDEILAILNPQPGEIALDATLGFGGHTQAILPRLLPGGRLFATDVDSVELPRTEKRLRKLGFGADVLVVRNINFAGIAGLVPETVADGSYDSDSDSHIDSDVGGFDCILADLGVSSMQLDNPSRGFSYKNDGPLDLRLNPARGEPASLLLQSVDELKLIELLTKNADEPQAALIAHEIKNNSAVIETTQQLAEAVRAALDGIVEEKEHKKTLARVFQALRIAVNDEFGVLDRFLGLLPWCMKPNGRVAVLTFHSGEDKRVERAFQQSLDAGVFSSISTSAIRPSGEEQRSNPRSTAARLRWAIRADFSV